VSKELGRRRKKWGEGKGEGVERQGKNKQ